VSAKRARLYDVFALITAIIVIALDQWTKSLVLRNLINAGEVPFPLVGYYLVLQYAQNNGAAFSIFQGSLVLALLIGVAIIVVATLYLRMLNSGSLILKLVFGLIIGGAFGNLIDRLKHGGYVVDFVSFRIPEIKYYFAIFNVADACISVGVFLLLVIVLFGGWGPNSAVGARACPRPGSPLTSFPLGDNPTDARGRGRRGSGLSLPSAPTDFQIPTSERASPQTTQQEDISEKRA
jgi:signal peptidase II